LSSGQAGHNVHLAYLSAYIVLQQ